MIAANIRPPLQTTVCKGGRGARWRERPSRRHASVTSWDGHMGCRTSSDSAPRGCGKRPRHDMASWRGEAFPWRVSLCLGVAPLQEPQLDSHCRSTAVGKRDGIKLRLGAQKRVVSATLRNHSRCHPRRARAQRRESRGKNLTPAFHGVPGSGRRQAAERGQQRAPVAIAVLEKWPHRRRNSRVYPGAGIEVEIDRRHRVAPGASVHASRRLQ